MADRAIEQGTGAAEPAARRPFALPPLSLTGAQRTVLALAATVVAVFAVQAPVLGHYFFSDDFVPLADIASRSTGGYIKDLFLLNDLTPNWRFLTGLVYLAEYRTFHLNPLPYLLVNVVFHTATAGLIFWLVRRATNRDWPAFLAAGFFGLSAASVPTVGQITALNNVLAGFFLTLAIVLLFEALDRERSSFALLAASLVAFAAAIASNESVSVTAPVLVLVAVWKGSRADAGWQQPAEWVRIALFGAPFALLGSAALIGFAACGCTEAELYSRENVIENIWLYFGRLLYPIGLEFPGHIGTAHLFAGVLVATLAGVALLRGPALARIAAIFLCLAILPYLPISIWSAQRYTYLASIPFAILVALFFSEIGRYAARASPVLAAAVAATAIVAMTWSGWQTLEQNAGQADAADKWRQLVSAVEETYPSVPPLTTVYIRGGPVTDGLVQCAVMPAIADVLWTDALLFTFTPTSLTNYRARPGYNVYVGDFVDGKIEPQAVRVASAAELQREDIFLLPHISPRATGNVCRLDVPLP